MDKQSKLIPIIIYVVSITLILDTVLELAFSVWNLQTYQHMFAWMPPRILALRYFISIVWRYAFIVALVGVCLRQEFFRRMVIVLTWMGAITIFWRHPYQAIVNADIYMHTHLNYFTEPMRLPWTHKTYYPNILRVMLQLWIEDLFKAVMVLLFFSFEPVRKFFK